MNIKESAIALAILLLIGGCGGGRTPGAEACADTKILRVKVGDALFAFPNTIGGPLGVFGENKKGEAGVIYYKNRDREPDDRLTCNKKEKPIADFGDWISLDYTSGIDDKAELANLPENVRKSRRLGEILVKIHKYDPNHGANKHKNYYVDIKDIEKIRFVKRVDLPRQGSMPGKSANFEFQIDGKSFVLKCGVGTYYNQPNSNQVTGRRQGGGCNADNRVDPTFRADDLLISVRTSLATIDGEVVDLPPQDWPKMWAYATQRVLSYRVAHEGAQQ